MPTQLDTNAHALGTADLGHEGPMRQTAWVALHTERLFRRSGIGPGQRVLELGSGVGDVALIVAQLTLPRSGCSRRSARSRQGTASASSSSSNGSSDPWASTSPGRPPCSWREKSRLVPSPGASLCRWRRSSIASIALWGTALAPRPIASGVGAKAASGRGLQRPISSLRLWRSLSW